MDPECREVRSDEARSRFRDLLNAVEHDGEHVVVLRYNTPAAVIVPLGWYEDAKAALAALSKGAWS